MEKAESESALMQTGAFARWPTAARAGYLLLIVTAAASFGLMPRSLPAGGIPGPHGSSRETGAKQVDSPAVLENDCLRAEFGARGLVRLVDRRTNQAVRFPRDGWAIIVEHRLVTSDVLRPVGRTVTGQEVRYAYREGPFRVEVVYELRPDWRFVAKRLELPNLRDDVYTVRHVDVWRGEIQAEVEDMYVAHMGERAKRIRGLGDYAAFLRMAGGWGLMFLTQNPFFRWQYEDGRFSMDYRADLDWRAEYGPFVSDRACIGFYDRTGVLLPANVDPHGGWTLRAGRDDTPELVDRGEIEAFMACVRAFALYKPSGGYRIHVPWCENDYQIDVSTDGGAAQFRRIVDSASRLGIRYMLYTVRNDAVATQDEASDAWHWEHLLWFNMGIKIRRNRWDPATGVLPERTRQLMTYARERGIGLMAYVYPTVAFEQDPSWLTRRHLNLRTLGANTGYRSFQDWFLGALVGFAHNTGAAGYSFDYWPLSMPGRSFYSQWYGARRILEGLRRELPEIVIDGRQTYHGYGPWTWLAGNYPHPMGGDEQPESFECFPDLHVDHSYGTQQRLTAYWYHVRQFCPPELQPGCIGHQTARRNEKGEMVYDRDFNVRDWDYLGWRFSFFSSIATAPFHHVFGMIPARDPQEYQAFLRDEATRQFVDRWLSWTEENIDLLRFSRPITGPPGIGRADGWSAINGERGFVFLFNPNHRKVRAEFSLDERIGLKRRGQYLIEELYPQRGKYLGCEGGGVPAYGKRCSFELDGTSVLVLEITPRGKSSDEPLLLGLQGKVALNGDTVEVTNAVGEVGSRVTATVVVPPEVAVRRLTVNGSGVSFEQRGRHVYFRCRFAGEYFPRNKPIVRYDPKFVGRRVAATVRIPARVFAQLRRRRQAWPIEWSEEDYACSWLAPERLLVYVQIAEPDWKMEASLRVDGEKIPLRKAYSSRTPGMLRRGRGHNTFLGFFADVSHLEPDAPHLFEVTLPEGLTPGQFQGVYFVNVETEYTDELVRGQEADGSGCLLSGRDER